VTARKILAVDKEMREKYSFIAYGRINQSEARISSNTCMIEIIRENKIQARRRVLKINNNIKRTNNVL